MSDELREKLARAYAIANSPSDLQGDRWRDWLVTADAAIALVRVETLEEAAKVAVPGFDTVIHVDGSYSAGWKAGVEAAQAAIRALKDKP
jgi:hypothetical protein